MNSVCVIGSGGVGFWLAAALRRDLPDATIICYDPDDTDGSGGRRLPASQPGYKKVRLLEDYGRFTLGEPNKIQGISKYLTANDIEILTSYGRNPMIFVDCTDMSNDSRRHLWTAIRNIPGSRIIRVSYDGNGWVVVANGLAFGDPTTEGYDVVPTMAQSLAAAGIGAQAVLNIIRGRECRDYQINTITSECLSTFDGGSNESN